MIISTNKLRQMNNELVINYLRDHEYGTKSTISRKTGLSISSCRNILNDLVLTGEVKELDTISSTGGRPSIKYIFNKNHRFFGIISLSIDGENNRVFSSILNLSGDIISEKHWHITLINVPTIIDVIKGMIEDSPRMEIITIGIPGVVINGKIGICDIPSLENVSLKELIEKELKVKIILENDVNASALGFYHENSEVRGDVAYLYYPNFGIPGAGLIINGKIIRGTSNFAGEIRFLPFGEKFKNLEFLQNDLDSFYELIIKTILSVNCIVNPTRISISWKNFTEEKFNIIKKGVNQLSTPGHIPELSYNKNIHTDYFKGLTLLGLKEMSCKLKVVES